MPKLILNRPDPKAPGTHKARKQIWLLDARMNRAKKTGDEELMVETYIEMETWLLQFATTDDGSDPAVLIDQLSSEEFDETLAAFRGDSLPLKNGATSTDGSTAAPALPTPSSIT